jgi:hypothetical protein
MSDFKGNPLGKLLKRMGGGSRGFRYSGILINGLKNDIVLLF